jgi:hypothetical protein
MIVLSTILLTVAAMLSYLSNVTGMDVSIPIHGYLGTIMHWGIFALMYWAGFTTMMYCTTNDPEEL